MAALALSMVRERIDSAHTPEQALLVLRGDARPFALIGAWAGGRALVGSEPVALHSAERLPPCDPPPAREVDDFVGGAWVGSLGFPLAWGIERLPAPPPRPDPAPACSLAFYDHLLRMDDAGGWWFEALEDGPRARSRLETLRDRLQQPPPQARAFALADVSLRAPGYAGHRAAVAEAVERIRRGDLFQVNLCLRYEARLRGTALDLFAHCSARLTPPYAAYVSSGADSAIASLSPELFLRRRRGEVLTSPIKGTGTNAAQLAASAKDRAEHVMIVDLMRNDLGRVCAYGSVAAEAAPRVEHHPGVVHLVSDVRGRLHQSMDDRALLRATFPPGSVTGAPKIQALKLIAELEATGREAYTGAIGFLSPHAGLELNVAIRTFELRGDRVWLGAGGGVVADSDPGGEVLEAWRKAAPLFAAAGARLPPPASAVPVATRAAGIARPDPGAGVLTTLGVWNGRLERLDQHLARLRSSCATLFGLAIDLDELRSRLLRSTAGAPPGRARLRVVALPGGELRLELHPAPVPPAPQLRPVALAGGLGAHKWADRRSLTPGILLHDLDGSVLEAAHANVVLLEGTRLVTPAADGRILPGITRAALGERLVEEAISLERLRSADAILLTSSVALVRVAQLAGGGTAPASAHELAARLRSELRA
ncbi:MAG: hypothetical protein NVSMB51_14390 [Solirubrobacteraceae bacterium]